MKKITKDQIYIAGTVVILLVSVVLFFYPEKVKYPYSFVKIEDKKESVVNDNFELVKNESEIKGLVESYKEKESQEEFVNEEAIELKRNINEKDFKLSIPSVLISLEQEAKKLNLDLNIHYSSMETVAGDDTSFDSGIIGEIGDIEKDLNVEDSENLDSNDEEKTVGGEPVNENNDSKEENKENVVKFSEEEISNGTLLINGLNTTVIPLVVEGNYSSVRSYIEYLDEIGMIEPSQVSMESDEKKVTAKIVINIFHGEVY